MLRNLLLPSQNFFTVFYSFFFITQIHKSPLLIYLPPPFVVGLLLFIGVVHCLALLSSSPLCRFHRSLAPLCRLRSLLFVPWSLLLLPWEALLCDPNPYCCWFVQGRTINNNTLSQEVTDSYRDIFAIMEEGFKPPVSRCPCSAVVSGTKFTQKMDSSGGIFPPYRRSHLCSNTYHSLVHILSHLHSYHQRTQAPPPPPDNGTSRTVEEEQEKQPKGPQPVALADNGSGGSSMEEQEKQPKEPQVVASVDNGSGSTVEQQEKQPKEPQLVASADNRSGITVEDQEKQQLAVSADNASGRNTMVQEEKQQQEPQFVASAVCKDLNDIVKETTQEGTGGKGSTEEITIANNKNGLNDNECGGSTIEEQEKQPKEPQKNPNDLGQETSEEGTRDKGSAKFTANDNNNVLNDIDIMIKEAHEEVEDSSTRHVEELENMEQRLMDELDLVFKETHQQEEDNGLIPLNSSSGILDQKRSNAGSQVAYLVDYKYGDVQVQKDQHNQLISQTLHLPPSSTVNVSESAKKGHDLRQQKEIELVESVCTTSQEHEFEKESRCGQKVDANVDVNIFVNNDGLPRSGTSEDKHEIQNLMSSFDIPFDNGDIEDGEIFGDFMLDGDLFDLSSVDPIILQLDDIDEELHCKIGGNGEKEQGFESISFIVNTPQHGLPEVDGLKDHANSSAVKQKDDESEKKKSGPGNNEDVFKPETVENITFPCNLGNGEKEQGFESNSFKVKAHQHGSHNNEVDKAGDLPTNFAQNQVYYGDLWDADVSKDMLKGDVSSKKKRGPGNNEEKKAKKKQKQRKRRAEINRQHGVKRLKLSPPLVQKPKPRADCRHYRFGRCYEGDKCKFSHDIVPLTKSTPCCHFARHSCMKGDDCPFDHQLSKYPCANFVSQGSCGRGDACLFSHQVPTEKGIPTLSNVSRRELKKSPSVSGNTNSCMQINNGGCNPTQQSHFFNSMATHSPINAEHTGTSSVQKKPIAPPKGISFLNVAKQGMVSANKTNADPSASGTNKASAGIPKKSPALTPKGINFLSFGKGSVCSFKSSSSSLLNRESGKLQQVSSSLNNDDYSKVYSHGDHRHGKSVQGGKRAVDSSLTSTLTSSSMLLVSPSVSNQPSASSSGQRAMISTLAFAAEHESDIKMKPLRGEQGSSSILFN